MSNRIELLSPAGSLEKLKIAFLYGADACYIGGYKYSLRANATNFSIDEIKEACEFAHKLNKKVYVTINMVFHNEDTYEMVEYLEELSKIKVDAIIVSDVMVIDLVNKNNIDLSIHVSTQASTLNYEAALFFKSHNVDRIVLGRELSKEEIKEIIDKTNLEIETFVHGAMCSSYSGRCVLSNYFTNRDANRGGCAQICRWCFNLCDNNKNIIEAEDEFSLAVKDLNLIEYLKEMIEIGITSLKIEGRMRSEYYIATVVSTYKEAIDKYYNNKLDEASILKYNKILSRVANRDSMPQFFNGYPENGNYYIGRVEVSNQDYLAIVLDYDDNTKIATLSQRNYFKKDDIVEFFGPNIDCFEHKIDNIYNGDLNSIDVANHPTEIIKIRVDKKLYPYDIMRRKIY